MHMLERFHVTLILITMHATAVYGLDASVASTPIVASFACVTSCLHDRHYPLARVDTSSARGSHLVRSPR